MMTPNDKLQAFRILSEKAGVVINAEQRYNEAKASELARRRDLDAAQEVFNAARDRVIEAFPALLDGFPPKETLEIIDGKLTVVEEER